MYRSPAEVNERHGAGGRARAAECSLTRLLLGVPIPWRGEGALSSRGSRTRPRDAERQAAASKAGSRRADTRQRLRTVRHHAFTQRPSRSHDSTRVVRCKHGGPGLRQQVAAGANARYYVARAFFDDDQVASWRSTVIVTVHDIRPRSPRDRDGSALLYTVLPRCSDLSCQVRGFDCAGSRGR